MKASLPTVPLHDVRCNGCGGIGGTHLDLRCPFFLARVEAQIPRIVKHYRHRREYVDR